MTTLHVHAPYHAPCFAFTACHGNLDFIPDTCPCHVCRASSWSLLVAWPLPPPARYISDGTIHSVSLFCHPGKVAMRLPSLVLDLMSYSSASQLVLHCACMMRVMTSILRITFTATPHDTIYTICHYKFPSPQIQPWLFYALMVTATNSNCTTNE